MCDARCEQACKGTPCSHLQSAPEPFNGGAWHEIDGPDGGARDCSKTRARGALIGAGVIACRAGIGAICKLTVTLEFTAFNDPERLCIITCSTSISAMISSSSSSNINSSAVEFATEIGADFSPHSPSPSQRSLELEQVHVLESSRSRISHLERSIDAFPDLEGSNARTAFSKNQSRSAILDRSASPARTPRRPRASTLAHRSTSCRSEARRAGFVHRASTRIPRASSTPRRFDRRRRAWRFVPRARGDARPRARTMESFRAHSRFIADRSRARSVVRRTVTSRRGCLDCFRVCFCVNSKSARVYASRDVEERGLKKVDREPRDGVVVVSFGRRTRRRDFRGALSSLSGARTPRGRTRHAACEC